MKSAIKTMLIFVLLVLIFAMSADANLTPVRITLGTREAAVAPSPVFDGERVFAPLSILNYLGASHAVFAESDKVTIVSASGDSDDVTALRIGGTLMVPIDKVLHIIGGESVYDANTRTLMLLAHLRSIEVVDDTLMARCTMPVSCSVHEWDDKLVVDVAGAKVATEAREVFVGSPLIQKARLGQFTDTTARVVIDLARPAGAKLLSRAVDSEVSIKISQSAPRAVAKPQTGSGKPFNVQAIRVQSVSDAEFNVVIETSGRGNAVPAYGVMPPQLTLSLKNAVLSGAAASPEGYHPLLSSIRCIDDNRNGVRVELNLARIMAYDVRVQDNAIIARVRLPLNANGSLADKLIMIDPGHGGTQKGAVSGDLYEKDLNTSITNALVAELHAAGARTILTRYDDRTLGISDRPQMAIQSGADFFISIHCNSNGTKNSASGIETYYHMEQASPRALAFAIHAGVCSYTGMCDRRARSDKMLHSTGLGVLRGLANSNVPGILLECGYMNHSGDRAKLVDPAYRKKLAVGVVAGLRAYVEGVPLQ